MKILGSDIMVPVGVVITAIVFVVGVAANATDFKTGTNMRLTAVEMKTEKIDTMATDVAVTKRVVGMMCHKMKMEPCE